MVELQRNTKQTYDVDIGLMRIIAAFFVILIHTSGSGSTSAVFFNAISRFSVPVFVMISGYYMLAKEPNGTAIAKKCGSLFLKMLVWAAIYYLYNLLSGGRSYAGVRDLITYLLTEPVHLWYCYASIALYLFTPLLYVFCKHAPQKTYQYALALTFVLGSPILLLLRSGLIPTLQVIVDQMKIPYTLGFIFLYLLGGYFRTYGLPSRPHRILLYLAGAAGTAVTFFGTLFLPTDLLPRDWLLSFFAPNTMVTGAAFFVFVRQAFRTVRTVSDKLLPYIRRISACTLGIYLMHPLILSLFQKLPLQAAPILLIPLKALSAFGISLLLVYAMKHIPLLKRLV